jgi:small subunit ribosomal protein S9
MPKKAGTTKKAVKKTAKKVSKKLVKKAPAHPKRVAKKAKTPEKKRISARITAQSAVSGTEAEKYIEAVGRRKTAVARVRLWTKGKKEFLINEKDYQDYFPNFELQKTILAPLEMMNSEDKFKGGGVHAQTEATRHGISRALVKFNPDFRKRLKKAGFLTRDPRMRERKKFGLKRARRAPQWSKR